MIERIASRSGLPTAAVDGVLLHSRFDPEKEADKFVRSVLGAGSAPRTIVILGESLGYLARAAKTRFPFSRIVSVCYSRALIPENDGKDPVWHPDDPESLHDFFDRSVEETDPSGIAIVEWPQSRVVYPEMSKLARDAFAESLRKLKANILTTSYMGRLWLRNSFINFVALSSVCANLPPVRNRIVMIAGSGPSLAESVSFISGRRDSLVIIALPSSVDCLYAHGIVPDIVVLTDPGYYSAVHLHPLARERVTVAMPLSACRGIRNLPEANVFFIEQPYFFERELLSQAGYDAIRIPPQGTVASTALQLGLRLTDLEIVCTGLDFSARDILTHARPNTFERLFEPRSCRTSPFYDSAYKRSFDITGRKTGKLGFRTSDSLLAYAGWFDSFSATHASRIFQLNPSEAGLNRIPRIDEGEFDRLIRRNEALPTRCEVRDSREYPDARSRREIASSILDRWESEISEIVNTKSMVVRMTRRISDLLYFYDAPGFLSVTRSRGDNPDNGSANRLFSLLEDARRFIRGLARFARGNTVNGAPEKWQ